jgi:hypothetical protein
MSAPFSASLIRSDPEEVLRPAGVRGGAEILENDSQSFISEVG